MQQLTPIIVSRLVFFSGFSVAISYENVVGGPFAGLIVVSIGDESGAFRRIFNSGVSKF